MRFERLRLTGFKSFSEPVIVDIQDGLTGVVGPNGCGKSNLLEALRWVMGENRPSAMRGSGMEDVIFAGTSHRKARAWAEVVMEIDNSDRTAPAAFNTADRLEVSRRVTRDLGSVYRINGKEVRARDVAMLFADAASGAHSPALIRQGHIAELINAKPQARRRLLEEAAGISGLYQRRHEAELRLRAASANLARLEDVTASLADQQAALRRQARAAERYRKISEALRQAEAGLVLARFDAAEAAETTARAALDAHLAGLSEAERTASATARAVQAAEEGLPDLREQAQIASAVLRKEEAETARLAEAEAGLRRDIAALEARREAAAQSVEREGQLESEASTWLANSAEDRARLEAAMAEDPQAQARAQANAKAAEEALASSEAAMEAQGTALATAQARHQSVKERLEQAQARHAAAKREHDALAARLTEAKSALKAASERVAQGEAGQQAAEIAAQEAAGAAQTAREALEALRPRLSSAQSEAASDKAALAALHAEHKQLARAHEADQAAGQSDLLAELVVPEGLEAAIAAALGAAARRGRAVDGQPGWRVLDALADPVWPEGATPLLSAMDEVPAEWRRRLQHVAVIAREDARTAQSQLLAGQCLVSAGGDLWRWDGYHCPAGEAQELAARFERANRLKALKADLERAEDAASQSATREAELRTAIKAATEEEAKTAQASRDAEKTARTLRAEAEAAARKLGQMEDALSRDQAKLDDLAATLDTAQTDAASLQAEMDDLPDLSGLRTAHDEARARLAADRQAMMAASSARDQLERDVKGRARRLQAIDREAESWRARMAQTGERLKALKADLARIDAELTAADRKPQEMQAELQARQARRVEAEQRDNAARAALSEGEAALAQARHAAAQAERAAAEAREKRASLAERASAAKTAREEAATRLEAALNCGVAEAREAWGGDAAGDVAELEQTVSRLTGQREALGAVNLRAEQDLATLEEEADALARERADLEEAIAKLKHGIAQLNKEGRARLLEAFETINSNFTRLFTELFGGGEARLVLVEADDPLEAGLEIMCSPPGKKLSTLSLLSGGEQTLTALALIFAMFLTNPAPICVLDEVDAPLDDANVARFCNLLDKMVDITPTRFMIITHHAVTMSRMDRLYGVTMQERGVSQLVSVDLRAAEAMVA